MAARLLRPLRDPALALLWGGLATAAVGDQLFSVVLSWVAVGAFGTAAGYLTMLQAGVMTAVAISSGGWADRRGRLAVMIGADLARAAVLVVVVVAWLGAGAPPAWSLLLCVLVLAAAVALFRPALQAALPQLAAPDLLPAANALLDTTERIARLLGPGVIGLAGALLPLVHFVTLDAATFLVSAAAVGTIARLRPFARVVPVREGALANLRRGVRALRAHRLLGFMLAVTGAINGAWSAAYFLGLPLLIARYGVTGPGGSEIGAYGLVISAYGSTNLLGTLVIGNRAMPRRPDVMIFAGNCQGGLGILLLGATALLLPPEWMLAGFCAGAAVGAASGPMQDIMVAVLRQTELPGEHIGAAVRAFLVVNGLGLLLTLAVAPTVFNAIGVAQAVLLCGAIYSAIGLTGLWRFRAG